MTRWASRTSSDFSLGPQGTNIFGERRGSDHGFTIVELLIVVVVIAILAAITIVAYNGITNRAKASAASSAAEQASKKVALYAIQNSEAFPDTLSDAGVTDQNGTTYQYRTYNGGQNYCITATTNSTSYYIDNAAHNTPTAGACAGHGAAGQTVVTDLATNPSVEGGLTSGFAGAGAAGTNVVSNASSFIGSNHIRRNFTGSGAAGIYYGNSSSVLPLIAGRTYSFSAWLRASKPVFITPGIDWRDSADAKISSDGGAITSVGTSWTRLSFTATAPAMTAYGALTLYSSTAWASGDYEDVDAVMITQGPTLHNYADGSSPGWAWNGAPKSSTSTGPAL